MLDNIDIYLRDNPIEWTSDEKQFKPSKESPFKARRLIHIVNPYITGTPEPFVIMASLAVALKWSMSHAQYMSGNYVDVVAFIDEKDRGQIIFPSLFKVQYFRHNESNSIINQPYFKELLFAAQSYIESSPHQYTHIAYTNADIGVLPYFYPILFNMLPCISTFFINRVEIPELYSWRYKIPQANEMNTLNAKLWSNAMLGKAYYHTVRHPQNHPGFDCFITRIDAIPTLIKSIGDVFLGYPPIGRALNQAAKISDSDCTVYKGLHATFHIGSRNSQWGSNTDPTAIALRDLNGRLFQKTSSTLNGRKNTPATGRNRNGRGVNRGKNRSKCGSHTVQSDNSTLSGLRITNHRRSCQLL